jgi:nucleotidyltransferase substrate binding protein (TIGR01987 family)
MIVIKSEFHLKEKLSTFDKISFYENFEAALRKLLEFQKLYDGPEIHHAGVIQAFEFTFEQCWKAIQKKTGTEGLSLASPKKSLEWAMASGWISATHENTWLEMMRDRNLTSHTYRDQTAIEVATRVLDSYVDEFILILEKMKKN